MNERVNEKQKKYTAGTWTVACGVRAEITYASCILQELDFFAQHDR